MMIVSEMERRCPSTHSPFQATFRGGEGALHRHSVPSGNELWRVGRVGESHDCIQKYLLVCAFGIAGIPHLACSNC